ncbi:hypothetical protein MTO96_008324 [Rhipicephalus appendiculatus]
MKSRADTSNVTNDDGYVGHSYQDISWDDATWIMTSSFIIFTMQSGEWRTTRDQIRGVHVSHLPGDGDPTIASTGKQEGGGDVVFGGLGYWMFGYGFSFGQDRGTNQFIAFGKFFLDSDEKEMGVVFATYIFQLSFATTATTIVSGAMAERCNFVAYCIFSFLNTVVFCLPAGWVWGQHGFLNKLRVVDIAGCAPVHLVGGASSLVAAVMLKPRHGRYDHGTEPPPMGSPTNALVGMFMLWWGWLGFNCGSTFGVSGHKWKYAARTSKVTRRTPRRPKGGHIEGHARGKVVKPERLATGEMKKGEIDGKAAEKPSAPGGGADQADRQQPEVVESEQTVNESSSDEDDLSDEEDESSDYTDETETDDSEAEEGSQED